MHWDSIQVVGNPRDSHRFGEDYDRYFSGLIEAQSYSNHAAASQQRIGVLLPGLIGLLQAVFSIAAEDRRGRQRQEHYRDKKKSHG